jgi:hypothetical protein
LVVGYPRVVAEPGDFWKPIGSLTKGDLETLMGHPERTVLDYKQARNPSHVGSDALAEDLCAFANTGLGRIVFGAEEGDRDDLARLPGVPNDEIKKLRSKIRNAAHAVQPPVDVDVQDVALADDASALVVEIRPTPGRGPHQYKGRYLMRSADGNTFMVHSNVVQAVLAASGSPEKAFGPPESGFTTIHPFGGDSPAGWFFGLQLSMAHSPTGPVFEVFDELGGRVRSIVSVRIAEFNRPVAIELDRIFTDRQWSEGMAKETRFQIQTDGTLSEFDRLRESDRLDVSQLLERNARERLVVLGKLAAEIAPNGWFQVAISLWGTSTTELQLGWPDGEGQLKGHAMVTVRSRRHHFPSELAVHGSLEAAELLWRFDNHLRIHAKAPVGPARPAPPLWPLA